MAKNAIVIIPTYNERANLEALVLAVLQATDGVGVLVVDDNSPDGTGALADQLALHYPGCVFVLHRARKEGLGRAYVDAYLHALATFPDTHRFVQMDADFSHDPMYISDLIAASEHCDLVVGSRYVNGISIVHWPLHRLIVSKFGTWFAQAVTGLPISDCTGGFKCFRREVLESIDLPTIRSNGYVFQVETSFRAWQKGYQLQDFSIIFYERQRGESKLHLDIALEAFLVVLRLGIVRLSMSRQRTTKLVVDK